MRAIKYGSATHHVLLQLRSGGSSAKTIETLKEINGKKPSRIKESLNLMMGRGMVVRKGDQYAITVTGIEELSRLARIPQRKVPDGADDYLDQLDRRRVRERERARRRRSKT